MMKIGTSQKGNRTPSQSGMTRKEKNYPGFLTTTHNFEENGPINILDESVRPTSPNKPTKIDNNKSSLIEENNSINSKKRINAAPNNKFQFKLNLTETVDPQKFQSN
jgi:hypothetical protein